MSLQVRGPSSPGPSGAGSSGSGGRRLPSASVAGSLRVPGSPGARGGRSSGIHTAPSAVARQIAPHRVASSSPGRPVRVSSGWPPCKCQMSPRSSSRTPGCESAARSLRTTVSVGSDRQSIRRSSWRKGGRGRPVLAASGRVVCGCGRWVPDATRATADRTASTAASAISLRYRSDLPTSGTGQSAAAQMSPASISSLAWRTVTPHRSAPRCTAQSTEDGPRSPTGPGCTIRQVRADHTSRGTAVLSIGATIRSGE